jgi:hypothetical protein
MTREQLKAWAEKVTADAEIIPLGAVSKGTVGMAVLMLLAERDELLTACKLAAAFDWKSGEGAGAVYDALDATIAKAEGK